MADWTNISTASLEPGAPVRSLDALALRDNPIAIAEGAAGAPRIETAAITNAAVTADKIASNAVTTAKILDNNVTMNKLAGDQRMTTANVTVIYAGQDAGGVGMLALLYLEGTGNITPGVIKAGSELRHATISRFNVDTTNEVPSGTWRSLCFLDFDHRFGLWIRVA
jgi:hypothetical protein